MERLAATFDVPVRDDFRGRQGTDFLRIAPAAGAAARMSGGSQTGSGGFAELPAASDGAPGVAAGYAQTRLKPKDLLTAYNALPLAQAGYTGKGQTIVVFASTVWQDDLDMFADTMHLPRFTPEVVGGPLVRPCSEASMDLAVGTPSLRTPGWCWSTPGPRSRAAGPFEKIGQMFDDAAERYPASVDPVDRMGV